MRSSLRPSVRTASIAASLALLTGVLGTHTVLAESAAPRGTPAIQTGCAAVSDPVALESVEQVQSLIVGVWVRCEGVSEFQGAPGDDVGIEFTGDGRYHRLYHNAANELIRGEGIEQQGRVTVVDLTAINGPGSYQLNLRLLGSGQRNAGPALFNTPPTLDLRDLTVGHTGRYERWTGAPPTAGQVPGLPDTPCARATGEIVATSVQHVQSQLIGSWTACGNSVFGGVGTELGVEFGDDGSVWRLVRAPDGTVIRATGPGSQGTWEVIDSTAMNGPGSYHLYVRTPGFGTVIVEPVFLQSPRFVRFFGGDNADYIAGAPPPGQPPPTELPETGGGLIAMLLVAAALVGVGGLARAAASRKHVASN